MHSFCRSVVVVAVALSPVACAPAQSAASRPMAVGAAASPAAASPAADQPVELGSVAWHRDYRAARAAARATDRPLLLLFQEVPGCATCRNYGRDVLDHPIIVGVAQEHFVPACIYNNTAGDHDAEVRQAFGEPAWNNPVVRIVDPSEQELAPRVSGAWTVLALAEAMAAALDRLERPTPLPLQLLLQEERARAGGATATAVYEMACFWSGEAGLGRLEGVVGTEAGWLGGREVVRVTYDPKAVTYAALTRAAQQQRCARGAFADRGQLDDARAVFGDGVRPLRAGFRADAEPKYHLSRSPLRVVPMTELQAARVNAHLHDGDWRQFLTGSQLAILDRQKSSGADWPSAVGVAPAAAWRQARALAAGGSR
ncbi:MAG: VPGUxxT family thioredoxin-like (seleno)protein, type 2 [Planctomycetota bacterium]